MSSPYEEADRILAAVEAAHGPQVAGTLRDSLDRIAEREGFGPAEYTHEARKFAERLYGVPSTGSEPATEPPGAPAGTRRVAVELPVGWMPVAEPPESPPGRLGKVTPDIKREMPSLAYRLHHLVEGQADRDGTFTCTRKEASAALRVAPRRIGYAMALHLAAGVWTVKRKGAWGSNQTRRRPARTLYQLAARVDQEHAIRIYQKARQAAAERTRGLSQAIDGASDGASVS